MTNVRAPVTVDVAVVGGGLLGLASAYKLLAAFPGLDLLVLEKEPEPGRHQSGHNSGVLHAGLSYAPGSAKARFAFDGIRQMVAFCRRFDVRHEICGKLVVAATRDEIPRLRALHDRGTRNGLQGLAWLDASGIAAVEPHAVGVAALHVPQEGIVDYPAVCQRLVQEITALGGCVLTGAEVLACPREATGWRVTTSRGDIEAHTLVNCAGLYADRVAKMTGVRTDVRIVPFRGRYFALRPDRRHLVRHLIYPLPDSRFPFLGVHLTRRVGGAVDAGPHAMLALAREGYHGYDVSFRDTLELVMYPGLWKFLGRHPRLVSRELGLSFGREVFARALRRLVPDIQATDLVPAGAGVRAQAMRADGELLEDFAFAATEHAVHLLNAPSPGATAALAIGDEVVRRVAEILPSAVSTRPKPSGDKPM